MNSSKPNDGRSLWPRWALPAVAGLLFFQLIQTFLPAVGAEPWQWLQILAFVLAVPSAVVMVVLVVAAIRRGIASQR